MSNFKHTFTKNQLLEMFLLKKTKQNDISVINGEKENHLFIIKKRRRKKGKEIEVNNISIYSLENCFYYIINK